MKLLVGALVFIASILSVVDHSQGARILAIIPTPSYSHQIPYRALWKALHGRGHEIVLITANPIPDMNSTTFTQIDTTNTYGILRALDFVSLRKNRVSWTSFAEKELWDIGHNMAEQIFEHPEFKKIYASDSNEKFDLLMMEALYTPALYGLVKRFNAPFIGLSSLGLISFTQYVLGEPVLPSHPSLWEMEMATGFNLSFWQRVKNFVEVWYHVYGTLTDFFPKQQIIAEKYLGNNRFDIMEELKSVSLMFVNQHEALTFPRPKVPKVIPFTSFHIVKELPPMSEELKRFIESSKKGFIYFSLGSNARSSSLPEETIRMFCEIFSSLPYNVVWKFEKELVGKPDNVYTAPWFPQQSILAHPKIKLFIYQGGLQSTEETIHFGVPVIGMPVLADQDFQVNVMVSAGVGRYLEITDLKKNEVEEALRDVLSDKRYKERMMALRNLTKEKPYDELSNLVWWTEFVIRHRGAPHLECSVSDEPWYQRYSVDVVAFLAIATFIVISSMLIAVYKFFILLKHCAPSGTQKLKKS